MIAARLRVQNTCKMNPKKRDQLTYTRIVPATSEAHELKLSLKTQSKPSDAESIEAYDYCLQTLES
jgi:hypothetical protein